MTLWSTAAHQIEVLQHADNLGWFQIPERTTKHLHGFLFQRDIQSDVADVHDVNNAKISETDFNFFPSYGSNCAAEPAIHEPGI